VTGIDETAEALAERARAGWTWIVVAALTVFMFATRMRPHSEHYRGGEEAYFFGTDPYYHTRQIFYTVQNWPQLLRFDPWTQFPKGTGMGTFGTLFDLLGASLTWLWSLVTLQGAPTRATVLEVATAYPAVLGALTVIPIFLLTRDLFGERGAVYAAVATALVPGTFLVRSLAGFPDHHIIEVLLSTTALWATYRALEDWQAAEVSLDTILGDPTRIWHEARWPLGTSLLAGLAYWTLMAAWPPGALFIALAGAWLGLQAATEAAGGEDPGPTVATAITAGVSAGLLYVPNALAGHRATFRAVDATWLQPLAGIALGLGVLLVALTARAWHERDLPSWGYLPTAGVLGVLGFAGLNQLAPAVGGELLGGASWVFDSTLGWLPGIDPGRGRLTIGEAQPTTLGSYQPEFGFLLWTGLFAAGLALVDFVREGRSRDGLLVVWTFVTFSAALTQTRFGYLFAVTVLVLNAKLAARLFDAARVMSGEADDEDDEDADRISLGTANAVVVALLALALIPVNVAGFTADCGEQGNAWATAECFGPGREATIWYDGSNWLEENTPDGGVDLAATYQPPGDGRPSYPDEAYGVLSWWDYGHQIQSDGERAPIANPFQQNAPLASEVFTADTEQAGLDALDGYLQGEQARYLMIDDAMATSKFGAITVWAEVDDVYNRPVSRSYTVQANGTTETLELPGVPDEARGWWLQEVYRTDADGYEHVRLVHEHPLYSLIGTAAQRNDQGQVRLVPETYNSVINRAGPEQMRQLAERAGAGDQGLSLESGDAALPQGQRLLYDLSIESGLKTYELVPGATIEGEGARGENVTVRLGLTVEPTGREFFYEQTATVGDDGTYDVTVPYPTTGLLGPAEGGTDADVVAQGAYRVEVGDQALGVDVPESAVLDGGTVRAS
jgi:dolichyl-diphosphooligosaccharide--protein glycosyltransferase